MIIWGAIQSHTGPLPAITLGIMYAGLKADDDEGLPLGGMPYTAFLDMVVELCFECRRNIADQLQALQVWYMPTEQRTY